MMPPVAEKAPKKSPSPTPAWDVGDIVYAVFWRPFPMPDNPNNGSWETVSGRLISAGIEMLCYEIDNPSLPGWFGASVESPRGSALRFINRDRAFGTLEEATQATLLLKPPGI